MPGRGEGLDEEGFDRVEDVLLRREGHLEVDLRELELAVRAEVLVAKTAGDLEVLLEARHHQDLLEELRRLRQRVELAAVDARGDQEVAGALRGRARQHGSLDFEKAPLVQHLPHAERDFVAQDEVLEHDRAAQVEVAVLEPELLGRVGAVLDDEGRRFGPRQEGQALRDDLDLSGRELLVALALAPEDDLPLDFDDVLAARLGRGRDGFGRAARAVEDDLHEPAPVADRQEDQLAEIPPPADPALEEDGLARVGGAQLPAF